MGRVASGHRVRERWRGEEIETLRDLLRPGLLAVVVGINPSIVSVDTGHYYQGRIGRRLWQRLCQAGLVPKSPRGGEDDAAFAAGVGFTDVVKRPTARANELPADEYRLGAQRVARRLEAARPKLVIFTYKRAAECLLGRFQGNGFLPNVTVADAPVFVMPGPYEPADRVTRTLDQLTQWLADRHVPHKGGGGQRVTSPSRPGT